MLMHFVNIMKQKCGGYVTVQLLQTLNILFENIRSENGAMYVEDTTIYSLPVYFCRFPSQQQSHKRGHKSQFRF